ncbi:MAG: ABC transporter ATP-binding protein [Actinomycetes bacterium]
MDAALPTPDAGLRITDLAVRYADQVVVHGVDLRVGPGEVVCVLGPSGSGKSTLLRAVAGLEPLAGGTIAWDATDLAGTPPHRRRFGLMFQDHALLPHRDVLANVAFGLRARGDRRPEAEDRARALLDLVGLAGLEHRSVRDLSGGEQQRVALARALAPDPRLLMLDEPLGSLDRSLRDHLTGELGALFARRERAVLLVTHDHEEAFALGDRVVVVRDGRIEQDGPAAAVWRAPANAFVAAFLGYGVTTAFGPLLAVLPGDLALRPDGPVGARVVDHTFRRDHFRVRVQTTDGSMLEVAVAPEALPPTGAATGLTLLPGAGVRLPH